VNWKVFLRDCSCNNPSDIAVILKSQCSINWLKLCMRDFLWARQLSYLCPDLSKIFSWFSFVTLVETLRCLAFAIKKFLKWYVECYTGCNFFSFPVGPFCRIAYLNILKSALLRVKYSTYTVHCSEKIYFESLTDNRVRYIS
jgi:hypothetical protein